jgi:hypothetical protein
VPRTAAVVTWACALHGPQIVNTRKTLLKHTILKKFALGFFIFVSTCQSFGLLGSRKPRSLNPPQDPDPGFGGRCPTHLPVFATKPVLLYNCFALGASLGIVVKKKIDLHSFHFEIGIKELLVGSEKTIFGGREAQIILSNQTSHSSIVLIREVILAVCGSSP